MPRLILVLCAAAILLGACATSAETRSYGAYDHYPEYAIGRMW